MSALLPVWRNDVKTISAAWRLRRQMLGMAFTAAPVSSVLKKTVAVALLLGLASNAHAASGQTATYVSGTLKTPQETAGTFDTSSPATLAFRPSTGGEIDIPYSRISTATYKSEVAHHLGVLPFIAVGLVWYRIRRHYLTIVFSDDNGAAQSLVFDLPNDEQRVMIPLLLARVPVCDKKTECSSLRGFSTN